MSGSDLHKLMKGIIIIFWRFFFHNTIKLKKTKGDLFKKQEEELFKKEETTLSRSSSSINDKVKTLREGIRRRRVVERVLEKMEEKENDVNAF